MRKLWPRCVPKGDNRAPRDATDDQLVRKVSQSGPQTVKKPLQKWYKTIQKSMLDFCTNFGRFLVVFPSIFGGIFGCFLMSALRRSELGEVMKINRIPTKNDTFSRFLLCGSSQNFTKNVRKLRKSMSTPRHRFFIDLYLKIQRKIDRKSVFLLLKNGSKSRGRV